VSSFGVGGTNAHVILEEAPLPAQSIVRTVAALDLSARTETHWLRRHRFAGGDREKPVDGAGRHRVSLQAGRADFACRRAIVCRDARMRWPSSRYRVRPSTSARARRHDGAAPSLVFMFPGQGAQYLDDSRPVPGRADFRADVDFALRHVSRARIRFCGRFSTRRAPMTDVALPCSRKLVLRSRRCLSRVGARAVAHALGCFSRRDDGHSIGEHTAACLAGVMSSSYPSAHCPARPLIQALQRGQMLVVHLPRATRSRFATTRSRCRVNAPNSACSPGLSRRSPRSLSAGRRGDRPSLLHTSHAFHSWMMDPRSRTSPPSCRHEILEPNPVCPGVSGTWITPAQATAPDYWSHLLRSTVRFSMACVRSPVCRMLCLSKSGLGAAIDSGSAARGAGPLLCVVVALGQRSAQ